MSRNAAYLVLATGLIAVAASQLLLKARASTHANQWEPAQFANGATTILMDSWVWLGIFLVLLGAGCWYFALVRLPLTIMMPLAALVAPMVVIGANVFLGEELSGNKVAAILIITVGAIWLAAQDG